MRGSPTDDFRGKDFFDACGADPFCSNYLGTGDQPYNTVKALHAKLNDGHCPLLSKVGLTSDMLADICGMMLQEPSQRPPLAAFIFRLDRCTKLDRGFIMDVLTTAGPLGAGGASAGSPDQPYGYVDDTNELLCEC